MNTNEVIDYLKKFIISGDEFDTILQDIIDNNMNSVSGIYYSVSSEQKEEGICSFGYRGEGKETEKSSLKDELQGDVCVEIFLWKTGSKITLDFLKELFKVFWNAPYCDRHSGLPTRTRSEIEEKCNITVDKLLSVGRKVAVIMMDLDHFKSVNDKYDHDAGSAVISEFANILIKNNEKKGIVLHQSGDEFDIILKYENPEEVLEYTNKLRMKMIEHKFQIPDVNLTMAIGVYMLRESECTFEEAVKRAEKAYFPNGKNEQKQRDSIRIDSGDNAFRNSKNSLKLALCRILATLDSKRPFSNVYLDYLSFWSETAKVDADFQKGVDSFLEWVNPEWTGLIRCDADDGGYDTKAEMSVEEVGLSLMYGLLRNRNLSGEKIVFDFGDNDEDMMRILLNGEVIFKRGKIQKEGLIYELDSFPDKSTDLASMKNIVLVKAGSEAVDIPLDIFYNIIQVDDRPFTGGGLPDLWTAALGELIADMKQYPYLSHIVVCGNVDKTKKIVDYLKSIDKWADTDEGKYSYEYIHRKIFKPVRDIKKFQEKFTNNIFINSNEQKIIDHIYDLYASHKISWGNRKKVEPRSELRILDRQLSYEKIKLDMYDGCRVKSIADAYPTILEILRNSQKNCDNKPIVDQAGRRLLELTNFKIVLEKPNSKELPDYYCSDEEELKQYYDNILGKDGKLFRPMIEKENQLTQMIEQIVFAIKSKEKAYATRRALLTIPTIIQFEGSDQKKYDPLGLVSIWAAPRFIDENADRVIINFSYTWRTVEALVGLPSSLYASVRFSEELMEMIQNKQDKRSNISVQMGNISYIAYSLHVFLDSENINIVRGIINEASI